MRLAAGMEWKWNACIPNKYSWLGNATLKKCFCDPRSTLWSKFPQNMKGLLCIASYRRRNISFFFLFLYQMKTLIFIHTFSVFHGNRFGFECKIQEFSLFHRCWILNEMSGEWITFSVASIANHMPVWIWGKSLVIRSLCGVDLKCVMTCYTNFIMSSKKLRHVMFLLLVPNVFLSSNICVRNVQCINWYKVYQLQMNPNQLLGAPPIGISDTLQQN